MQYREIKKDLFDVPSKYCFAHCINGAYTLGTGIAKEFEDRMRMRHFLMMFYPIQEGEETKYIGKALLVGRVFNLVTKAHHYNKPTYEALYSALKDMRDQCETRCVRHLAMPKIGCGLDRLDWDKVSVMIKEVFGDLDIDILICYL